MLQIISQKVKGFFSAYPVRKFDKRQLIIQPDEPLTEVFYIVDGLVSQYDITSSGNEVVVNIFKPGAFFPMSTALNSTPNPYFFEASTVVVAHGAPPADAVQFLKDNPDVALDLLSRVYRGVDGVLRRMTHLMGGDAHHRLIFELLNAAYRFGEPTGNGSTYVPLKEGDIAKHSGLARETVNRQLQALKTAHMLTVTHQGITLTDLKELEALLGAEV